MINNLETKLFKLITTSSFDEKILIGKNLVESTPEFISVLSNDQLQLLRSPGRPNDFQVVTPRSVPKRNFRIEENRINFLHAIANIELLAIELPALCLLRFGSQNLDFIQKQMIIISQEAQHFKLLKNRLMEMNCEFGKFPVHHGLWDYAWQCKNEFEHQIMIPCYLEARGLDVTPEFIKKFEAVNDLKSRNVMQIILDEEVEHVKNGMDYLREKAKQRKISPDVLFENTLKDFFGDKYKSKIPLNQFYRKQAGFSEKQMKVLK